MNRTKVLGFVIIVLAGAGLFGWFFDLPWLGTFGLPLLPMKPQTSLMLLLTGAEIIRLCSRPTRSDWSGWLLSGLLLFVTGIILLSYAPPLKDSLLVRITRLEIPPFATKAGRPSFITTLGFGLLGLAFLCLRHRRTLMVGQLLVLANTLIVLVALLGYMANIPAFYTFGTGSTVALPAALGLFLNTVSVLSLTHGQGLMRPLNSGQWGGQTVRWLALYLLVAPALLLTVYSVNLTRQWIAPDLGLLLVLYSFMAGTFVLFYYLARYLNEQDAFRQHSLDQLTRQTQLTQRVLQQTQAGIILVSPVRNKGGQLIDFQYDVINQFATNVVGQSIEKLIGQRVGDLFPGGHQQPLFKQHAAVFETAKTQHFTVHTENNQAEGWFEVTISKLDNNLLITYTDITALKLAELAAIRQAGQLELANFDLRRSNEDLKSFAYIASHDLQEPLRKITSFSNILVNQFGEHVTEKNTDLLRRIHESAHRMRRLIHDLLTYSRVETQPESFRSVALVTLIEELRENELWESFQQSNPDIQVLGLPTLIADPFQMRQLFQNLLSNAIKFTPKGTRPFINIRSRLLMRAEVPVGLLSPNPAPWHKNTLQHYYEISVTDNGIGFEQKYEDKIFQVFQRLHGRSQYEGSGIGLAICKRIVERHGGAITASSEQGQGSTFRIYLPLHL